MTVPAPLARRVKALMVGDGATPSEGALALGAGGLNARVNLAIALGMANRPEEAEAEFRQVLASRPEDSTSLFNYGLLLVQQLQKVLFQEEELHYLELKKLLNHYNYLVMKN